MDPRYHVLIERAIKAATSAANESQLIIQSPSGNQTAQLQEVFLAFAFAETKSVRTSTIILASFSVLAAAIIAASILYDGRAARRAAGGYHEKRLLIASLHPAEVFPLILCVAIVMQGIIFAVLQSQGLTSLVTFNCRSLSQVMFPALFIVPYIQLVFGAECTMRSLRRTPFPTRGRHDVLICVAIVVAMLVVTWLPSHLNLQPEKCFASLLWLVTRNAKTALIILATTAGSFVIFAGIIYYRLATITTIEQDQRIAASRMVYYLVVGFVSSIFIIPFFAALVFDTRGRIKLSMMATVVLNLAGLMTALLQMILRSNTTKMSFHPRHLTRRRPQRTFRIWGPNELIYDMHMADPIEQLSLKRADSQSSGRTSIASAEKRQFMSIDSILSPSSVRPSNHRMHPLKSNMPNLPGNVVLAMSPLTSPTVSAEATSHARKQSYSLFPTGQIGSPTAKDTSPTAQSAPRGVLEPKPTAAGSSPNVGSLWEALQLQPPPRLLSGKHRRDSSVESSATVQIGMRLSHAGLEPQSAGGLAPSGSRMGSARATLHPPPVMMGALQRSGSPTLHIVTRQVRDATQGLPPSSGVSPLESPITQKNLPRIPIRTTALSSRSTDIPISLSNTLHRSEGADRPAPRPANATLETDASSSSAETRPTLELSASSFKFHLPIQSNAAATLLPIQSNTVPTSDDFSRHDAVSLPSTSYLAPPSRFEPTTFMLPATVEPLTLTTPRPLFSPPYAPSQDFARARAGPTQPRQAIAVQPSSIASLAELEREGEALKQRVREARTEIKNDRDRDRTRRRRSSAERGRADEASATSVAKDVDASTEILSPTVYKSADQGATSVSSSSSSQPMTLRSPPPAFASPPPSSSRSAFLAATRTTHSRPPASMATSTAHVPPPSVYSPTSVYSTTTTRRHSSRRSIQVEEIGVARSESFHRLGGRGSARR